jgi:hypothetical protein
VALDQLQKRRHLADWEAGTMVGLTFVVLVVIAFGVVVLGLGLVLERLARRRRVGTPPRP